MIRSTKQKQITDMESRFVVARGERGECGMDGEFWVGRCKLLHLQWIRMGSYCTAQGIVTSPLDKNMMEIV